jgi:hypothetical protein
MYKISKLSKSIEKINSIKKCINKNEANIDFIGYSNGKLGFSLFYYYEHLLVKKDESLQRAVSYIEQSMSSLDENYISPNPQMEIIELGLYLMFLYRKGLLCKDIEMYLRDLDDVIEIQLLKKIEEGDLDFSIGFLRAGYYFIKRENSDKNYLLLKIIDAIESLSILEGDSRYWKFILRDPLNPLVELGLGHGVIGVISFLLHLYKNKIERGRCKILLDSSIAFVLSLVKKSVFNWLRLNAFQKDKYEYQNLSYGDIGIGYTLYKAGQILENKSYCTEALLILENAASFRDVDKKYIRDANLVHGASGLYSVFNLLHDLTNSDEILLARDYWYKTILEFEDNSNNPNWAGFNTYFNSMYEFAQLGFSQGIAGIGIALMTKEINCGNDYLSFLNYDL